MALGLYVTQITQRVGIKNAVLTINHFNPTNGATGAAELIGGAIETNLLPVLNALQGDYVKNVSMYTSFATESNDSSFRILEGEGARVTTPADIPAYFNTCSLKWRVTTEQQGPREKNIPWGGSRIVGLLDADIVNARLVSSFQNDYLDDLQAAWLTPIVVGMVSYYACIHVNVTGEAATWKIAGIDALNYAILGHQITRSQRG